MSGLFRGCPEPLNADGCSRGSLYPRFGSRLWLALAVAGTLTCGEGGTEPVNRAPSAVGKIPDQVVAVDSAVVVDASPYFADPDGDTLAYAASSSGTATVAGHGVREHGHRDGSGGGRRDGDGDRARSGGADRGAGLRRDGSEPGARGGRHDHGPGSLRGQHGDSRCRGGLHGPGRGPPGILGDLIDTTRATVVCRAAW